MWLVSHFNQVLITATCQGEGEFIIISSEPCFKVLSKRGRYVSNLVILPRTFLQPSQLDCREASRQVSGVRTLDTYRWLAMEEMIWWRITLAGRLHSIEVNLQLKKSSFYERQQPMEGNLWLKKTFDEAKAFLEQM